MTGATRSPKTLRGAVIALDPANPAASVVVFQYNPDTMTRTLAARAAPTAGATDGARDEALRLAGAPIEDISLSVEIDAADQLESGDVLGTQLGIYPQLSSLEMLLYPKSRTVIANAALARVGTMELVAPEAPLTLLAWGTKRTLPVRLTQFSITEQAYDPQLHPIRAQVSLGLRVLSYNDLAGGSVGYQLFLAHQVAKEAMATAAALSAVATAAQGATSGLPTGVAR